MFGLFENKEYLEAAHKIGREIHRQLLEAKK